MFSRANLDFSDAKQTIDDETKQICSGTAKVIIRVFSMGRMGNFVTKELFSSDSQINPSGLHTFSNFFWSR